MKKEDRPKNDDELFQKVKDWFSAYEVGFEKHDLEQFKEDMADRLEYLEEKQSKEAQYGNRLVIEVIPARFISIGKIEIAGERCALTKMKALPNNCFWIPIFKDSTGGWKWPDIIQATHEVPYLGSVTSNGKTYLTEQAKRYEQTKKILEYVVIEDGEKRIWRGTKEDIPDWVNESKVTPKEGKEGRFGYSDIGSKARTVCQHLDKVLSQDFPPEVWTALEHAYHAGRHSKLVDLHGTLTQDLTNHEVSRRQKKKDRLPWRARALELLREDPETKNKAIARQLQKEGLADTFDDWENIEFLRTDNQSPASKTWKQFQDSMSNLRRKELH